MTLPLEYRSATPFFSWLGLVTYRIFDCVVVIVYSFINGAFQGNFSLSVKALLHFALGANPCFLQL